VLCETYQGNWGSSGEKGGKKEDLSCKKKLKGKERNPECLKSWGATNSKKFKQGGEDWDMQIPKINRSKKSIGEAGETESNIHRSGKVNVLITSGRKNR